MDNTESGNLKSNYNKHLKLYPCEFYLLMVLVSMHENTLSPKDSSQKNYKNLYFCAQGHNICQPEFKLDLKRIKSIETEGEHEKRNIAPPAQSGFAAFTEANSFVIQRQAQYLILCLLFFISCYNTPCSRLRTAACV